MIKLLYIISILLCLVMSNSAFCMNDANHWFFGSYCGMNFNTPTNAPIFEDGSQMDTDEGCAAISDNYGNLLFYTDGKRVWNKEHVQMPNGQDLNGHESSTQSAVIVSKPGSITQFYVFTVDRQGGTFGMSYSIVDMKQDAGHGDIISKNNYLHFPVAEKITAIRHYNGRDIWVITHEWGSDKFLAYLLTDSGINEIPVVSSIGSSYIGDNMNAVGYMKASPDGTFIATTVYWKGILEILRFDNESGKITAPITFDSPKYQTVYGVEFSADVSKVYFSKSRENSTIYQVDLKAGDDVAIKNSITVIAESYSDYVYQALQIAPDKKIYVAKRNKTYLSVIESPNEKGDNCGFIENGFNLQGRICNAGLPTFNQSFLELYISIMGETNLCTGDTLILQCNEYDGAVYRWEGPNNFSSSESRIEIADVDFSIAGFYKVTILLDKEVKSDSIFVTILDSPTATIQQGDTSFICDAELLELVSTSLGTNLTLLWSTGEQSSEIFISEPGEYFLVATNENNCSDTAFISVLARDIPNVEIVTISGYPKLCEGEEIVLSTKDSYLSYSWSTGSSDSIISISVPGEYFVVVSDEYGCVGIDTISIEAYKIDLSDIDDLDYGNILIGDKITKTVNFVNTGRDIIFVTSISKLLGVSTFKLTYSPSLPIWLKTGEKIEITISFEPSTQDTYLDSIEIISAFPCNVFESFEISGFSGNLHSYIRMPDTTGVIGDINYILPIYARLENPEKHIVSYDAVISFNASIFIPDNNQEIIKSNQIINGMRVLSISAKDVELGDTEQKIGEIKGTVLLSKGRFPLEFTSFEWDTKYITYESYNGSLMATGVCKPEFSEIVLSEPLNFSLFPNPPIDKLTIKSNNDSLLIYGVSLVNLEGQSDLGIISQSKGSSEIIIDLSSFVAGTYLIIINTNIGDFTYPISIVR